MNTDNISINTHSSIRVAGSRILYFDPFKIEDDLHDADLIFITHDHYDHLDPESVEKLVKEDTVFAAPESIKASMDKVAKDHRVIYVKPGDEFEACGITVRAVPAYNKMKPFHPKKNGWTGYVAAMDGTAYYVAGDTDALKENQEIKCDVALVPVGGTYTMTAGKAAELVNAIHPAAAIPTHYGSVVGKADDAETFRKSVDSDIQVELKIKL